MKMHLQAEPPTPKANHEQLIGPQHYDCRSHERCVLTWRGVHGDLTDTAPVISISTPLASDAFERRNHDGDYDRRTNDGLLITWMVFGSKSCGIAYLYKIKIITRLR